MGDDPLLRYVKELQDHIDDEDSRHYSSTVLKESKAPYRMGPMADPTARGWWQGPCGDSMDIFLKVEGGVIVDVSYLTDGCGATTAVGSMLMRMTEKGTVERAWSITEHELIEALGGLPPENEHCAELALTTLHIALEHLEGGG